MHCTQGLALSLFHTLDPMKLKGLDNDLLWSGPFFFTIFPSTKLPLVYSLQWLQLEYSYTQFWIYLP